MKKVLLVSFAVAVSALITLMSVFAGIGIALTGAIVCLRNYMRSKSLPESEAATIRSSVNNRVSQAIFITPVVVFAFVAAGMAGLFAT